MKAQPPGMRLFCFTSLSGPRIEGSATFLHCVGLLFGHVSDEGELVHLPLIRLEQQDDPDDEAGQSDQRPDQDGQPAEEWNVDDEAEHDPEGSPRDREEDALEGVEADEPASVVGGHHEKDNRRNDRNVGQHPSYVVSHSLWGSGCDCGTSSATGTCRTNGGAFGNLCAAHVAESHSSPPTRMVAAVENGQGAPQAESAGNYQKQASKAIDNF
jgi:hypothetical protein